MKTTQSLLKITLLFVAIITVIAACSNPETEETNEYDVSQINFLPDDQIEFVTGGESIIAPIADVAYMKMDTPADAENYRLVEQLTSRETQKSYTLYVPEKKQQTLNKLYNNFYGTDIEFISE